LKIILYWTPQLRRVAKRALRDRRPSDKNKELGMPIKKKKAARRAWTPSDVRELKSLAKKKAGVTKISKALKRTIGATAVKAHQLGVSLDTRGWQSAYAQIDLA
jgi:hypothetical protein